MRKTSPAALSLFIQRGFVMGNNESTVTFINTSTEVKKAMEKLSRDALNASGRVIIKKLREDIPTRSKRFANHIGKWVFIGRKDGIPQMQIGFYGWQTVKKKHKIPSSASPHWIEFGTKPHAVTIKNAKVMAYNDSFYGRRIEHPGTAATHILRNTVHNNIDEIRAAQEEYLAELNKTIKEAQEKIDPREEFGDDD